MGKFVAGVIIGVLVIACGAYVYIHYGFIDMRADQPVMAVEHFYLAGAMDRYAERYAPKARNPMPPTDETLVAGVRIYNSNCVFCHGGPERPISELGRGLFPKAPQFLQDVPDMPEEQNFWITKHGIARTGMPAWDKTLSDNDIWKVVTLLSRFKDFDQFSPAVQQEWKGGGPAQPGAPEQPSSPAVPQPHAGHHHHHE
jgi:mono/diheme cytochrome c family protein